MACLKEVSPDSCLASLAVEKKEFLCDTIHNSYLIKNCIKWLFNFEADLEFDIHHFDGIERIRHYE
jgi:hypothetical protein